MNLAKHTRPFAILIVDDHDLVRLGVRALLQSQVSSARTAVEVFEAKTLAEALTVYEHHHDDIDLVMLDLALPDARGVSGVVRFHMDHPDACIVVLSGTGSKSLTQDVIAQGALAAGASAFLPKSASLKEVVSFIRACGLLGSDVVGGSLSSEALTQAASSFSGNTRQTLAPRHLPVLHLVLEGKNNREIAEAAHLSEGTVKNYVSTILLRLGMRSRAELIGSLR